MLCASVAFAYACSKKSSGPTQPIPPSWPSPDPVTLGAQGFPPMPIPADNPTTVQGIALGRRLFHDPLLSADSTLACAGCHQFGRAFSDDKRFSQGINMVSGSRNAPALINSGWLPVAFWDGRAPSLEEQAKGPVAHPDEMASNWDSLVVRLQQHAEYPDLFGRAFGSDVVTQDRVVQAIAQFERTFISANSRYDRFLRGEATLTPAEMRGSLLFVTETADCFHCHGNIQFTDNMFHNVGVDSLNSDPGLGAITGNPSDIGRFKTPTLRNLAFTAPYMHDGRFQTLEEVVNHYNDGVSGVANLSPFIRPAGVGLGMTPEQMQDVVAFLMALNDSTFVFDPTLAAP